MSIRDILEAVNGGALSEMAAAELEQQIREVIAQDLEDLVYATETVEPVGVPQGVEVHRVPWNVLMQLPAIQQTIIRGAANAVRGLAKATDNDWSLQYRGMMYRGGERRRKAVTEQRRRAERNI